MGQINRRTILRLGASTGTSLFLATIPDVSLAKSAGASSAHSPDFQILIYPNGTAAILSKHGTNLGTFSPTITESMGPTGPKIILPAPLVPVIDRAATVLHSPNSHAALRLLVRSGSPSYDIGGIVTLTSSLGTGYLGDCIDATSAYINTNISVSANGVDTPVGDITVAVWGQTGSLYIGYTTDVGGVSTCGKITNPITPSNLRATFAELMSAIAEALDKGNVSAILATPIALIVIETALIVLPSLLGVLGLTVDERSATAF